MRDVTYAVESASISIGPITDEPGTDAPPRMQNSPTNPSQPQLNLPENLIRWNGWSNAAPRPGTPLADDASSGLSDGTGSGPFDQMAITVTPAPGSLPRLRSERIPAWEYALRARVVDIAGNVIALDDPNAADVGDALNRVSPLAPMGALTGRLPDVYAGTPTRSRASR